MRDKDDKVLADLMHRVESLEATIMQQPRSSNVILEACIQARISLCETFKSMISDAYFSQQLTSLYSECREQYKINEDIEQWAHPTKGRKNNG